MFIPSTTLVYTRHIEVLTIQRSQSNGVINTPLVERHRHIEQHQHIHKDTSQHVICRQLSPVTTISKVTPATKVCAPPPYNLFLHVHAIDRKVDITMISKHTNTHLTHQLLFHKAPRHASVEERGIPTNKNIKHPSLSHTTCPNTTPKTIHITNDNTCRKQMTGQGRGAARDLTEDPDFVMTDAISPP